jgi:hypothetical protein
VFFATLGELAHDVLLVTFKLSLILAAIRIRLVCNLLPSLLDLDELLPQRFPLASALMPPPCWNGEVVCSFSFSTLTTFCSMQSP